MTTEAATMLDGGLLTVNEATAYCRLSRSDLYQRMDRGELAFTKIGKRRLIPKQALVELAERGLVMATAEK